MSHNKSSKKASLPHSQPDAEHKQRAQAPQAPAAKKAMVPQPKQAPAQQPAKVMPKVQATYQNQLVIEAFLGKHMQPSDKRSTLVDQLLNQVVGVVSTGLWTPETGFDGRSTIVDELSQLKGLPRPKPGARLHLDPTSGTAQQAPKFNNLSRHSRRNMFSTFSTSDTGLTSEDTGSTFSTRDTGLTSSDGQITIVEKVSQPKGHPRPGGGARIHLDPTAGTAPQVKKLHRHMHSAFTTCSLERRSAPTFHATDVSQLTMAAVKKVTVTRAMYEEAGIHAVCTGLEREVGEKLRIL